MFCGQWLCCSQDGNGETLTRPQNCIASQENVNTNKVINPKINYLTK